MTHRRIIKSSYFTLKAQETKIDKFANSVDPDEVAYNEPPHQHLHCLPSTLRILNMMWLGRFFSFSKFSGRKILSSAF